MSMKLFTKGFLLLLVMSAMFVKCNCKKTVEPPVVVEKTIIEKISHDWVLSTATKNGADAGFDVTTFTLVLRETGGEAKTFTIAQGASPTNPSPNGNSGDWKMNATFSQLIFLAGQTGENIVTVVGTPTESSLKIKWVDSTDKNDPTYEFTFVAQ